MTKVNNIDPLDIYIGRVIKDLRISKNITQEALGQMVGVTFQQIQKYESGKNRISASSLFKISFALDSEISNFYPKSNYSQNDDESMTENITDLDYTYDRGIIVQDKDTAQIVKLFNMISDQVVKKRFLSLLKSIV